MDIILEVLGEYGFDDIIAYALRFILRNSYESFIIVDLPFIVKN